MPSLSLRALTAAALLPCLFACGEGDSTPEPSSAEGSPTEAPTPVPPRPAALSGAWAVHAGGPLTFDNDLNGPADVDVEVWSLVEFGADGALATSVCRVIMSPYDGAAVSIVFDIPDEVVGPGVAESPDVANVDGGWDDGAYQASLLILAGAEDNAADPWSQPLPTNDAPEQAPDDDADGQPGVTVLLDVSGKEGGPAEGLVQEYQAGAAFRLGQILSPDAISETTLSGEADLILDISLLWVSPNNPYLVVQDIYTSPAASGPRTFSAVPVAAGSGCGAVLATSF